MAGAALGGDPAPLAGFSVGVTADRRREELVALLRRQGAQVLEAPAVRLVPLHDDQQLERATRAVLATTVDVAVATTGVGFRGWIEAAEGWGLGERLREHLGRARIVTRGPKATGAVRAAGLREAWSPASEAMGELLERLLAEGVGRRRATVALQEHGEPMTAAVRALRRAGASVIEVPVYRWRLPGDRRPLRRLVGAACAGQVDAITFTSAPAVGNLLRVAADGGRKRELVAALKGGVLAACVGPVCALPLERLGVPTLRPARARLGALVRAVAEELPTTRTHTLVAVGHEVVLRGRRLLVDGHQATLAPAPAALLRALASQPGRVFSRAELLALAAHGDEADEHAVEVAVGRLRRALGPAAGAVQTVVKRGYRLAVDGR